MIDAFWRRAKKYQPSLSCEGGDGVGTREEIKRIKWVVWKKEDITMFKQDLVGHTVSIQLLLAAVQM